MPNTIAENLQRLVSAKADIASAITAKGGTVNTGDGFEEFPADIATIPSGGGGGGDSGKPVRFLDYDGTVVASYTAEEFAQVTAMPPNPTHAGLTAQGWNWSLSDAQAHVAANGMLDVGQMYITDDNKTRLYIELTEGRISPWLKLYLNANSELDIDWGDGTPHSTFTSTGTGDKNKKHDYASAGSYIIAITVVSGGFSILNNSRFSALLTNNNNTVNSPDIGYLSSIKRIEMGSGITSIGNFAFARCYSLSSVTIPNSVTSIGSDAFTYCYSLSSVTIPNSVTSISSEILYGCYSLSSVTIPNSVTSIDTYAFSNCYSLSSVTIPNSVIGINPSAFGSCYSLVSITIPSSVTAIGSYAFGSCYSLGYIKINKPEGSISGSPWGATTGSPTYTQIIWTG